MSEFLAFIVSGTIECFESNFKQRLYYFLKIVYYSIAIIFTIGIAHEVIIFLQTDSIDETIIGKINESLDQETLIYNFLFSLIFPVYAAYTLWLCQVKFNHKKISLSLSLIIATIICILAKPHNILPKVADCNLIVFLFLPIIAMAFYLILSNIFTYKMILRGKEIWHKYRLLFTYIYVLLFILFMLYYSEAQLLNIIVVIISSAFLALMLIYVRRLLGFYYAIALHYILTMPVILATGYMLLNQVQ